MNDRHQTVIQKHSSLYIWILSLWAILTVFGVRSYIDHIHFERGLFDYHNLPNIYQIFNLTPTESFMHFLEVFITALLIINIIFVVYFWLNGIKDLVYTSFYRFKREKIIKQEIKILNRPLPDKLKNARVVMLYCTCNDIVEAALASSLNQDFKNYKTVILDDSFEPEYLKRVDTFAKKYQLEVVRRLKRNDFKAGNLNNYLQKHYDYDYFVVLDSDEIIPDNFIKQSLHYFAYYDNLGILQANHISTRDHTKFMQNFSLGVNAHWATYQSLKQDYGFMSFLGHGAIISKSCYEAVGAFPPLVAEDISFTVEAQFKNYMCGFSNLIVCEEEFPIDYFAFKKRHLKWTGGNLEFIRTYTKSQIKSHMMTWFEKLDIFLFAYNLPMTSVFFLFLVINLVILPVIGYSAGYPRWLMTITVILLVAPMTNDMTYLIGKSTLLHYFHYIWMSFLLYGSLYWLSLSGATKSWLGIKPKFIVTPKAISRYSFKDILIGNIGEIVFGITLLIISLTILHSFLPVFLIVIPSLSGIRLSYMTKPVNDPNESRTKKDQFF